MNYAREQRLRMIEFLLVHYGRVNRKPIMDYFGISPAAATLDFRYYNELTDGNMVYSLRDKTYYKSQQFKRVWG